MATLVGCTFADGDDECDHVYQLAGNTMPTFVIGEPGSPDDFFLIGCKPEQEAANYPLLTGTFLNSDGEVLFKLVRNELRINPGHCSKITGNHVGYEIHDSAGELIFKIETIYQDGKGYVTTMTARCYDKSGNLVFEANSGSVDEKISTSAKCLFGNGPASGMTVDDIEIAMAFLAMKGRVYEPIRGTIRNQDIELDGKLLINAHLIGCNITIRKGDYKSIGNRTFEKCKIVFLDAAGNVIEIYRSILSNKSNVDLGQLIP